MSGSDLTVVAASFGELDPGTAYAVWRLRQDVFVVEQECPYPDLDGRDPESATVHVVLREGEAVVGYARVLDDTTEWRIGRVVLAPAGRGRGLADRLMTASLESCPDRDVVLDAQSPLAAWYAASASPSTATSSSRTGSRTCRCVGRAVSPHRRAGKPAPPGRNFPQEATDSPSRSTQAPPARDPRPPRNRCCRFRGGRVRGAGANRVRWTTAPGATPSRSPPRAGAPHRSP